MLIRALSFPLPNVEPEVKYFLVRFVQCFGVTEPVSAVVKDLAKGFGMSDRQVSQSLKVLSACDVLVVSFISDGRGRTKSSYRLQEAFVAKLKEPPQKPTKTYDPPPLSEIHEATIGGLLRHENSRSALRDPWDAAVSLSAQMRARREPGRLSVVNRLLLGVLLCHADRFGVVRDLGSSALRKATGLTQERLKYRIKILFEQGLLSAHVPGVTSTILCKKMQSTYFVNLHHPELVNDICGVHVLTRPTAEPAKGRDRQRAFCFWDDVRRLEREPSYFMNTAYEQVPKYFHGQPPLFVYFLQAELGKYAAHLLSNSWSELVESGPGRIMDDELCGLIRETFRPSTRLPSNQPLRKGGATSESQLADVVDELYRFAYEQAIWIKQCVSENPKIDFTSLEFVVVPLPPESNFCAFSVLALPKASSGNIFAADNYSGMN